MAATKSPTATARKRQPEPLTLGLVLIIAFKSIGAILLWGAFVLLLVAGHEDPRSFFSILVFRIFRGDPPLMVLRFLVDNLQFVSQTMVIRVAIVSAAYATITSGEAIGLILRKVWAEWLVILVTVSFIPFEAYELATRPNFWKAGTLVINLAILVYLVRRELGKRAERRRAILHQS
ncbi:MAG TPA: DUF2127 domain-containing protein [Chloroflexota bacterium]|nr:DUF2127 domain-containing protein [Chloroflexota bacterium]